ncbi:MAG TPA: peptide chain release factor 1 [Rectinemataceae bacterium]|nr:peptide chain release factor 1 [Rectinemataceae bacterium]
MVDKLEALSARLRELDAAVAEPGLARDAQRYRELMRERSKLAVVDEAYAEYKSLITAVSDARALARDEAEADMRELAREELRGLEERKAALEARLQELIAPRDPLADKPAIMEIRAGTGGEEAALFVADLFRMYSRYSDKRGWKIEVMDSSGTELGGFREIVFSVTGDAVFENLRWESGVHRVQRVPATEGSGRIHTSAVTVAVLPEMEETEIEIRDQDLRVDVMRSSGPGGQSVNTTDSAVRITHLPTGLVVHCQDEKSQIKNKAKAMRILRARLFELEDAKRQAERAAERRSMVGSGDRSERIRTYNFPQNRISDHRIDLTLYKLDLAMEGDIDELIDGLVTAAREELMKASSGGTTGQEGRAT